MIWSLLGFKEESDEASKAAMESQAGGKVLECDYDKNCTALYKAMEKAGETGRWEPVAQFLDTGYWPHHLFVDPSPPRTQVKTWVTRSQKQDDIPALRKVKDNKKNSDEDEEEDEIENGVLKWSQLPLHLALILQAPFGIVRRLTELYPQAVQCTDDQYMLPLHLALRFNANDDVVAFLLTKFPKAVVFKGKNDRSAVESALRSPNKLRGKILHTFVEETKKKCMANEKILTTRLNEKEKEIVELRASLESVEVQLKDVKLTLEREAEVKDAELKTRLKQSQASFKKLLDVKDSELKKLRKSEARLRSALETKKFELLRYQNALAKTPENELVKEKLKELTDLSDTQYKLSEVGRVKSLPAKNLIHGN